MSASHLRYRLRSYWANDRIHNSVRVLIALAGVTLPAWYRGANHEITPLVLGILAAALAEVDDNLTGKIKSLVMMLLCFLLASLSIELLFDWPPLFAIGLFSSTFGFIMLGAMGARYASIAFASLLLAVYTMLDAHNSPNLWYQPALLLSGALWYGLLSLAWHILWPNRPVQQGLAGVFTELAAYLESKSQLFVPVSNMDPQPMRLVAAGKNARLVAALNAAKATLLSRVRRHHSPRQQALLQTYFLAQDIHERVSSSHYRYQDLASAFGHSDILFRFQRVLMAQARDCRHIARALAMGKQYHHGKESAWVLDELQHSLDHLKSLQEAQPNPQWRSLLIQLDYLFNNLATVELQMSTVGNPEPGQKSEEEELADFEPRGIRAMIRRIRGECHRDSLLFRHAVRLSIALTAGYGIIQFLDMERGYWILLTTLFVCQPNYSATRQKLTQRVVGTLGGLLLGMPLLYLFPGQEGQLVLMVLAGVLFFAFRTVRYDVATACITLLVLFCFNQLGQGFAVILPRLGDTLLGCLLAVMAVSFILPDWESRRLNRIMALAIGSNRGYLAQIIGQYQQGKHDHLAYRIARRSAHNTDARLHTGISNMLSEPERFQVASDECFRFLTLSHAMLSYISALGAHRSKLTNPDARELVNEVYQLIDGHLVILEGQLTGEHQDSDRVTDLVLEDKLGHWHEEESLPVRMILQQLHLIHIMLPELHALAERLFCVLGGCPRIASVARKAEN